MTGKKPGPLVMPVQDPSWLQGSSVIAWRDPKTAEEVFCQYRFTTQRQRYAAELYALAEIHRLKRRRCYLEKRHRAMWIFESLRNRNAYYDELVLHYDDLPVQELDRYAELAKRHGNLSRYELDKRANLDHGMGPISCFPPVKIGAKDA